MFKALILKKTPPKSCACINPCVINPCISTRARAVVRIESLPRPP